MDRDQILIFCEFLNDMAANLSSQDTNEDAQFWANTYNAEVLLKIKKLLEDELLVPESAELPTWKKMAEYWKDEARKLGW